VGERARARYKRFCYTVPIKSFVKIGITKIFCHNSKMFSSNNKTFGCCSKIFGCGKKLIVPNFVAVTNPFFPWGWEKERETGRKTR